MKKFINYHIVHFIDFIYIFYNNYFYYLFLKLCKIILKKIYGKKTYNIIYNNIFSPVYVLWILFVIIIRSHNNNNNNDNI